MSGIAKPKEAGLDMFIAVENLPESPVVVKVHILASWKKIFTLIDTYCHYIDFLSAGKNQISYLVLHFCMYI